MLYLVTQQIELIIKTMGTPPIEEIYQISKTKSRECIFKLGQIEPKNFKEIFPNASEEGKTIYNELFLLISD
jgi:hypothetical protein